MVLTVFTLNEILLHYSITTVTMLHLIFVTCFIASSTFDRKVFISALSGVQMVGGGFSNSSYFVCKTTKMKSFSLSCFYSVLTCEDFTVKSTNISS